MHRILRSIPFRFAATAFGLFLAFSLLSRIALTITSFREIGFGPALFGAFATGFLFDLAAAIFAAAPWLLLGIVMPDSLLRKTWMKWLLAVTAVCYTGILVFITTAEWFFWDEFGARFNFIAVDYLIWTQEVWGNISESYPMSLIIPAIVILAALVVFGLKKFGTFSFTKDSRTSPLHRVIALAILLIAPFLTFKLVSQSAIPSFANQYDTEIAKNGCWSFSLINWRAVFVFLLTSAATAPVVRFLNFSFAPLVGGLRVPPHADAGIAGNKSTYCCQNEEDFHGQDTRPDKYLSKLDFQEDAGFQVGK